MNITVPDLSDEPLSTQMDFPGQWWNIDRDEIREERLDELRETLPNADVVGVVDSDADGLGCEVVLREAYEGQNVVVIQGRGGEYGFDMPSTLSLLGDYTTGDTEVVVADLAPDAQFSSFLAGLATIDGNVGVYDHHEWEWFVKESIRGVVDEVVVSGEEKCAAQVVQEHHYPEADEQMMEFLEVTADHDLWIKEDERSDHLSTLAFAMDREEYVEAARKYGADMLEESDELRTIYEESEEEAEARAEIAVNRAEWKEIGNYDVAMTYGSAHQSRVGDTLLNEGADLAVIVKPTLKVSFRSTEDADISSTLARGLGGGGHPTAAGAKLYHHIPEPEHTTKFEHLWENDGEPALNFMEEYLTHELN